MQGDEFWNFFCRCIGPKFVYSLGICASNGSRRKKALSPGTRFLCSCIGRHAVETNDDVVLYSWPADSKISPTAIMAIKRNLAVEPPP